MHTALGRTGGAPPPPPAVRIRNPEVAVEDRIASLRAKIEALAGKTLLAGSPAEARSIGNGCMVLITGPSRTADIEQILVRGVHGPGEIHIVVV